MHYPHLKSKSRLEWNKKPDGMNANMDELPNEERSSIDFSSFKRAQVDSLFLNFKEWLDGTVEDESRTPMCDDSLNDDVRLWVHLDRGSDDDEASSKEDDVDEGEEESEDEPEEEEEDVNQNRR